MRRLLLACFSIESGVWWRDLGDLEGKKLVARWDSLNRVQPRAMASAAEALGLRGELADVSYTHRQVASQARLLDLFAQERRDEKWVRATERAAQALAKRDLSPAAAAFRASAFDLVRLKRAEDAAGFGSLAFAPGYAEADPVPVAIQEILPAMRASLREHGERTVPSLLKATLDYYTALAGAGEVLAGGSPEEMSRLILGLAENRAVAFDPAHYADHVERIRFEALLSLLSRQVDFQALPSHFFPGEKRAEAQDFLAVLLGQSAEDEWREAGRQVSYPFYNRWALARAETMAAATALVNEEFDRAFGSLARTVAELRARARSGQDWTEPLGRLLAGLPTVRAGFRDRLAGDPDRSTNLARLDAVAAALERPLPVVLSSVTVRLAPEALDEPSPVMVELTTAGGRTLGRTEPFLVGPAAPAGTGWVGSQDLAQILHVAPGKSLVARVFRAGEGVPLLTISYPAPDGVPLPGALTRLHQGRSPGQGDGSAPPEPTAAPDGRAGSLVFKTTDRHWRQLAVPGLAESESFAYPASDR